ncbi:DUF4198 domain-containing protein [Desulfoscipio gibsoniae]|uniref:Nickel uptake transporter family protein n=1 Tax=Desulfoscipio gibsoniae DSM 7213 TaxID=767817 RepID=R4KF83_9FIRM|nr:DUF4198 domain-containing protein [Desulfoscipio gibsoniae]AGL01254.1 nickel uptake transporter family protein [Desulfoscipio gibsoniae DSM 7213]
MTEQAKVRHAIWLEPTHLHFHHGDNIEVKVLWGLAMHSEGGVNPDLLKGYVIDPNGVELPAQITPAPDGLHYVLAFSCGHEGMYTVQVESDAASGQWARVLVPVGHHVHGHGKALNRGMEIVPGTYGEFHPGDAVVLTVLNNGIPMAGARVRATYHLYEGTGFAHSLTADDQGRVQFVFDARGHWLFQVDSVMDNRQITATLVIPGVRG